MNARNRVFMILGLLTLGSLIWYLLTARTLGRSEADRHGRCQRSAGQRQDPGPHPDADCGRRPGGEGRPADRRSIESDDLAAARKAAEATVVERAVQARARPWRPSARIKARVTSATINAEAQVRVAQAALAQAQANLDHQQADTTRTVALAKQGIMSEQAKDEAVTSLQAAEAAVETANANVAAAEAALRQAQAHELLAAACRRTPWPRRAAQVQNAQALADQASVELGYSQVFAPVTGKVNVLAARQGEVLAAGGTIVTVMDLTQTWVYAPLPETQADAVQAGRQPARGDAQRRNRAGQGDRQSPQRPISPRSATSTAAASATSRPSRSSC